ncbi:MAG: hypothetical protein Q9165_001044 [Trypethelium subeluteriae]
MSEFHGFMTAFMGLGNVTTEEHAKLKDICANIVFQGEGRLLANGLDNLLEAISAQSHLASRHLMKQLGRLEPATSAAAKAAFTDFYNSGARMGPPNKNETAPWEELATAVNLVLGDKKCTMQSLVVLATSAAYGKAIKGLPEGAHADDLTAPKLSVLLDLWCEKINIRSIAIGLLTITEEKGVRTTDTELRGGDGNKQRAAWLCKTVKGDVVWAAFSEKASE